MIKCFTMQLPNYISIMRLLLVPFVIWAMLTGEPVLAFLGFVIAGVSDGIDGWIARRFDMRSELGAYLDPAADKLLLVSIFFMLGYQGVLPVWLVAIIIFRDALIVSGVIMSSVMGNPVAMQPLLVSKANTVAQIVLASLMLAKGAFAFEWLRVDGAMIAVTAALTIASMAAYLVTWMRHMAEDGETGDPN